MGAKQDRDARLKKEMLQWLGERDESVRQTFEQFDQKVGQGFQGVEFKFAVMFKALERLGMTGEELQNIANSLQKQPEGGGTNEQAQSGPAPTASGDDNQRQEELPPSDEGGDEHFGRD